MGFVTDLVLILYKAFLFTLNSKLLAFFSFSISLMPFITLSITIRSLPRQPGSWARPATIQQPETPPPDNQSYSVPLFAETNCIIQQLCVFYFMALSDQCSSCAVTCRPGEGVHAVQSFPSRSFLVDSFPCFPFSLRRSHCISHQRLSCPEPDTFKNRQELLVHCSILVNYLVCIHVRILLIFLVVGGGAAVPVNVCKCARMRHCVVNVLFLSVLTNKSSVS